MLPVPTLNNTYESGDEDQRLHEDSNSRMKNKINDYLCPLEGDQRTGHEKDQSLSSGLPFVFY